MELKEQALKEKYLNAIHVSIDQAASLGKKSIEGYLTVSEGERHDRSFEIYRIDQLEDGNYCYRNGYFTYYYDIVIDLKTDQAMNAEQAEQEAERRKEKFKVSRKDSDRQEVFYFYRAADALRNNLADVEGLASDIRQAMASEGYQTSITALPAVFGEGWYITENQFRGPWAKILFKLIKSPKLAMKLKKPVKIPLDCNPKLNASILKICVIWD